MTRSVIWVTVLVAIALSLAGSAFAGPYWGATYSDGRGVVCRDTNKGYYAMFTVPNPAGGLTTGQRAAIIAGRLNSLFNPKVPYRTTQIVVGTQNGQYIIYIANRNNNNWLITTIDSGWARAANLSAYGTALYWRDRMRWLASNWVYGKDGKWQAILTSSGQGERPLTADEKLLANPTVCDKIPKGYENRATPNPPLKPGDVLQPLPATVPEGETVRQLK